MKIVVELIFIAILLASIWTGYKKGLVMTIGSIVIIIISLFVGDLLSDTFSHEAVPIIKPFVEGYMEGSDGAIYTALDQITEGDSSHLSVEDVIEHSPEAELELCRQSFINAGVYKSSANKMAKRAVELSEQSSMSTTTSIVEVMCQSLTYAIGFVLFFALVLILLVVLGNITNLSFKLPHAGRLNTLGGAAAGLVVGFMFCCLAAWILKLTGKMLPESELGGIFAKLFVKMNLFSQFLTI